MCQQLTVSLSKLYMLLFKVWGKIENLGRYETENFLSSHTKISLSHALCLFIAQKVPSAE